MLRAFKNALKLIQYNFSTLILFELLHKVVAHLVLFPIFFSTLEKIMNQLGLNYLSVENITVILSFNYSWLLLLLFVFIMALYLFFEITAVILCLNASMKQIKLSVFEVIRTGFLRALTILNPRNLILLLLVMLFIPLTNFIFTSGLIGSLNIPEFILDFIHQNQVLSILYYLLILLFEILIIRWIFSFHEIVLSTPNFKQARSNSILISKGHYFLIIKTLIIWMMMTGLLFLIFYHLWILLIALYVKLFYNSPYARTLFFDNIVSFKSILYVLTPSFSFILNCAIITSLYAKLKEIPLFETQPDKKKMGINFFTHSFIKVSLMFFLLMMIIMTSNLQENYMGRSEFFKKPSIIAHRASSVTAPENTIAALKAAILAGANQAEIDVQQTKDGELIIMHDSNFKRTTGVDKLVGDVTYEEIQTYDAGGWFHGKFYGEKIPTLEQFIISAKDQINLLIEIKASNDYTSIVEKTLSLIEKYDVEDQCIIASMDYEVLQESKKLNKKLKTAYITALAYGDFEYLNDVDIYSIEASFVTPSLIHDIQSLGKQIYIWTINTDSGMKNALNLDVDGIITDNPFLLEYYANNLAQPYASLIADWLFKY